MECISRIITKQDLDELYASPEAKKWLIPYFLKREYNRADDKHACLVENKDNKWKLFRFLDDHETKDITDWLIYFEQESIVIAQERDGKFVILFCSEVLKSQLNKISDIMATSIMEFGYYLDGKPENDYWNEEGGLPIGYVFAKPNDKGRYMSAHSERKSDTPKISYRKITNEDLDMLYSCPEVNDALVPLRGDRELAEELVDSEWSVAVNSTTGELMFCLGQMWSYSELTPRYLYFYKNKMCTFIDVFHAFQTISIFYCSDFLDINYMKSYFNLILNHSNEFLTDEEVNHDREINFNFIKSKELFRDDV